MSKSRVLDAIHICKVGMKAESILLKPAFHGKGEGHQG